MRPHMLMLIIMQAAVPGEQNVMWQGSDDKQILGQTVAEKLIRSGY